MHVLNSPGLFPPTQKGIKITYIYMKRIRRAILFFTKTQTLILTMPAKETT